MAQGCEDLVIEGYVDREYESVLDVRNISIQERLFFAILERNPKRVKYLVEQGANVNFIVEEIGWSPLMCASMTGMTQTVRILLQNGADPNYYSGQYTPLMCLCVADFHDDFQLIECFNLLIAAGANVNARSYRSMTPLMFTAAADNSHLTMCLLSHGADLDAVANNGWSAIFFAVSFRNPEVVRVLSRAGSNLALRDENGITVRDLASSNDNISRILSAQGYDYHFSHYLQAVDNKKLLSTPMPLIVYNGFYKEVLITLKTIGLKYLIPFFIEKKIGYGQFLLFNDEEWKKMGVQFHYDRQKLIWQANHLLKTCWACGVLCDGNNDLDRFWFQQIIAQMRK